MIVHESQSQPQRIVRRNELAYEMVVNLPNIRSEAEYQESYRSRRVGQALRDRLGEPLPGTSRSSVVAFRTETGVRNHRVGTLAVRNTYEAL